jgi:hypothetical protein
MMPVLHQLGMPEFQDSICGSSPFTAMKDFEHHQPRTFITVLKYVRCVQDLQCHLAILVPPCYRPTKLWMFLKHVCGIDDRFGHDRRQMGLLAAKESLESIKIGERVHRPFELHRSCHDLNTGDPHVRSHRTTASFDMVGPPASIAAHRRSSSVTSSADNASGEVASNVISARRSGTDRPRSAALASRAMAVCSSTSMRRFGAFMKAR